MIGSVDLTPVQAIVLAVAFFAGGFAKGGVGFAFPMIVIAISSYFVELDIVLAAIAVIQPFINIFQFTSGGLMTRTLARFWPVMLGLAIGAPVGALLLPIIDRTLLILGVGILIIAFVFWLLFRPDLRIPPRAEAGIGSIVGVAAGILGTLTTINGPIFVSYFVALRLERQAMVTALGLLFLLSGILIAGSFLAVGVLNGERFLIALGCAVPCGLGIWAGTLAGRLIPERLFRSLVLSGLFLLGVNLTVRALSSL